MLCANLKGQSVSEPLSRILAKKPPLGAAIRKYPRKKETFGRAGETLMRLRRVALYCCLLISLHMLFLAFPAFCYDRQDAEDIIREAENEISECYIAVCEAEKAGANVSELLATLNEAGWLLSRAKLAYNHGDYDLAVELANQSMAALDGFIERANALMDDAVQEGFFNFTVNFVGSAVGAVAVVVGGYAVWFYSKRRERMAKV